MILRNVKSSGRCTSQSGVPLVRTPASRPEAKALVAFENEHLGGLAQEWCELAGQWDEMKNNCERDAIKEGMGWLRERLNVLKRDAKGYKSENRTAGSNAGIRQVLEAYCCDLSRRIDGIIREEATYPSESDLIQWQYVPLYRMLDAHVREHVGNLVVIQASAEHFLARLRTDIESATTSATKRGFSDYGISFGVDDEQIQVLSVEAKLENCQAGEEDKDWTKTADFAQQSLSRLWRLVRSKKKEIPLEEMAKLSVFSFQLCGRHVTMHEWFPALCLGTVGVAKRFDVGESFRVMPLFVGVAEANLVPYIAERLGGIARLMAEAGGSHNGGGGGGGGGGGSGGGGGPKPDLNITEKRAAFFGDFQAKPPACYTPAQKTSSSKLPQKLRQKLPSVMVRLGLQSCEAVSGSTMEDALAMAAKVCGEGARTGSFAKVHVFTEKAARAARAHRELRGVTVGEMQGCVRELAAFGRLRGSNIAPTLERVVFAGEVSGAPSAASFQYFASHHVECAVLVMSYARERDVIAESRAIVEGVGADGPARGDAHTSSYERSRRVEKALQHALAEGEQLLTLLAQAHSLGVVHGDIKSDHVRSDSQGRMCLLDFDFAQASPAAGADAHDDRAYLRAFQDALALPGGGTDGWRESRVDRGAPADPASDVFSSLMLMRKAVMGIAKVVHDSGKRRAPLVHRVLQSLRELARMRPVDRRAEVIAARLGELRRSCTASCAASCAASSASASSSAFTTSARSARSSKGGPRPLADMNRVHMR
eukprot:TRINITY_DN253_c0_g1_i6.p1 TRINITY_DN253_c0_g1~~TRINITY_DN253_c0_g1_i6.p1  ORF type:complete len:766 (-),score=155.21 TRINITY_DN253_c0_g1_i6:303-2600(-)